MRLNSSRGGGTVLKTKPKLSLSLTPTSRPEHWYGYNWLIYGEEKIGKSTLGSVIPDEYFLLTKAGDRGLDLPGNIAHDWEEFSAYIDLLCTEDHGRQAVIVDIADKAYDFAFDAALEELGIKHPTDVGYAKGWDAIKKRYVKAFDKLYLAAEEKKFGVILLSHVTVQQINLHSGGVQDRFSTTMPDKYRNYFKVPVDIVGYYSYYDEGRYLTIGKDGMTESSTRPKGIFLNTKGERIHSIPMGNDEEEAFNNVTRAFENRQVRVNKLEVQKPDRKLTFKEQTARNRRG